MIIKLLAVASMGSSGFVLAGSFAYMTPYFLATNVFGILPAIGGYLLFKSI